jgi:hypothetical protein
VIAPTMSGRKVPRSPSDPDTSPMFQANRGRSRVAGASSPSRTLMAGIRSLAATPEARTTPAAPPGFSFVPAVTEPDPRLTGVRRAKSASGDRQASHRTLAEVNGNNRQRKPPRRLMLRDP